MSFQLVTDAKAFFEEAKTKVEHLVQEGVEDLEELIGKAFGHAVIASQIVDTNCVVNHVTSVTGESS